MDIYTCTWSAPASRTISIDTILMRTHNNRLRTLPRNLRNNTALRKRMRKLTSRNHAPRRNIALHLSQQPIRRLLASRSTVVPVVVVGKSLQVRLHICRAKFGIQSSDGWTLCKSRGISDGLALCEGCWGVVEEFGDVEEVCSGLKNK